jgi:methionyl-tRNA synthetase
MSSKYFYITTTLPYVNDEPHVGFAMEIIRADVVARYKKLTGYEVFFNTGTDEHGKKLLLAAEKDGKPVKEYVDFFAERFRGLGQILGLSSDLRFIRTTDEHHMLAAQEMWNRVAQATDEEGRPIIYKSRYDVKYCPGCELEKSDSELVDGHCPEHPSLDIEHIDEENYFFRWTAFEKKLLDLYENNPSFVIPNFRLEEIRQFVSKGLKDFSISRLKSKMPWGIPVPKDEDQVMYVWFDALTNYISTLGWPNNEEAFNNFWLNGTPTQYCGKNNLRQQAAMWQAMLLAAGIPTSHQIVINGFFTGEGGIKMSKSIGNVVNPYDVVNEYGADALRYFVCREVSMFEDSPFTMERFRDTYNGSLANGLGNLVSRLLNMAVSYEVDISTAQEFVRDTKKHEPLLLQYEGDFARFELDKVMNDIFGRLSDLDKQITETEPFKMIKTDPEATKNNLADYVLGLAEVAVLLQPFMPATAEKIFSVILEKKKPEAPLFLRK